MEQDAPVTALKGVGDKTAQALSHLDIFTVRELLSKYPRTYIQYPVALELNRQSGLSEGMHALKAHVARMPLVRQTKRMPVTTLTVGEEGHAIELVWYRMPYIRNSLKVGRDYVFYGRVSIRGKHYVMEQAVVYEPEKYGELERMLSPVYPLTAGLTNNKMISAMKAALLREELLTDYVPQEVRRQYGLGEYNYAVKQIHFPDDMEALVTARERLVFDEFFLFLMGIQYQKEQRTRRRNAFSFVDAAFVRTLAERLPYALTGAQQRTLDEILSDMQGPYAMQRLIQGDVGSGKTIVAFLAMAWVSQSGHQSAIMAPTEVLARQHYESFTELVDLFGLETPLYLLTGSMTAKQKREIYEAIASHPDAMIIGTHALIQEKAVYSDLALVITDEQHRFGVRQRDMLSEKGSGTHILVMSATPIPRTLAIILYGDLDISIIDEVPARRKPVKNTIIPTAQRGQAYDFILEEVQKGHQAYIICPLVEESEQSEGENVKDYAARLAGYLPKVAVGILHGRMKPEEKNRQMEDFAQNRLQILVSTTVVEVGVNVPNATVMMIENADRFGLAQLHQLRGRVGRGDAQSYCFFVNASGSKQAKQRLEILYRSNDGFHIAGEDLKLRGPGDFFGIRQSGDLAFELADIYQDAAILKKASEAVADILDRDPELTAPGHEALHRRMEHFMDTRIRKMNL